VISILAQALAGPPYHFVRIEPARLGRSDPYRASLSELGQGYDIRQTSASGRRIAGTRDSVPFGRPRPEEGWGLWVLAEGWRQEGSDGTSAVSSWRSARLAEVGSKAKAAVRYQPWRPKSAEEGSGDLPGSYPGTFRSLG
jgi:hypothetical protein